ncbi:malto-oligosyltrehalose synthase [Microlunatus flavus]|uniref:(1->4)-alpha-D-glucan 1-alpha-D-glucosylmutase n=1 Tax=Microlunatus flavus TaxID=1036181 RepID=A0A1H9LQZ4_9ACTN|nr:malto-oligosyltrehalose synthase [Microlunatus flavus]SER13836.1 (1->4)-alpha-D-glucan 1-alpha-D-glucosylmutase [Microlunatus flavus]
MTPTVPSSTYRLQITGSFTLGDAAALTDYLRDLGVGAVYCSPLLQAASGSDHGYDTVDPTRIDADRGGEEGLRTLLAKAGDEGLGVVVDIVPNHLGIAEPSENPAFFDVLRLGQESAYAPWFDIDWAANGGRVLLPVLGDDAVLRVEDGELRYYDHRFPLAPGTWSEDDADEPAEAVHARQHYELAHWTRANEELNYRRFFAVTTLAGVRQEDPDVFEATHALVATLPGQGVTGLRVDHPDGLVDPAGYLEQLRAIAPDAWITVEKILEPGEELPPWPVEGTTGYDAMREVNGVFVDHEAEARLTDLYRSLTGDRLTIAEHVEAGKRMVDETLLPAELHRMARLVPEVPDAEPALAEVAVAFDVYRSYLPAGVEHLDAALALAAQRRPELVERLEALRPRLHDADDELARRMQQLSGATMAKGVEDTAYYRYARFVALNEVGGNPDELGIPLARFHELQADRQEHQPDSMTALSTHDTKRGEDVRARLAVLAEVGDDWERFARRVLEVSTVPNEAFAYFMAQTLAGAGRVERERMHAYAEKAMREASDGTTWTEPDEAFEASVHALVDAAYDGPLGDDWDALTAVLTAPGWSNALGQKLVQLTMPGVPDVYQGTEVWEDSLVDPDNRRPVDHVALRALLASVVAEPPAVDASGAAKLWVVRQALRARAEHPELFRAYDPVAADGPAAAHLVGFDRGGAITLATRLPVTLAAEGGWRGTAITLQEPHVDLLTGRQHQGTLDVGEVLDRYPVALLLRA